MKDNITKVIFFIIIALTLLPILTFLPFWPQEVAISGYITSPIALLLGFGYTLIFKNPYKAESRKAIKYLLKIAIVGLGFKMLIGETLETSVEGLGLTIFTIFLTVGLGMLLTKLLKLDRKLGHLITSGTAICGGSAIAAVSPVIKADSTTISTSLGIVFLLNSVALLVFPEIGHLLDLTQKQFGLWSAVAIHDTSSVVGAAHAYGEEALRIATTVKLSRTLWIIPLSVFSMFLFKTKGEKIKIPYFILYFIIAILINSSEVLPKALTTTIASVAKQLLITTLFLVGSTISIQDLKTIGMKPVILGITLWVVISISSLVYILN